MIDFTWQNDSLLMSVKGTTIALDPLDSRGNAQVKLFTNYFDSLEQSLKDLLIFNTPGEYEVENTLITGIASDDNNTIYTVNSVGVSALLITQDVSDNVISRIGAVDIAFIDLYRYSDFENLSKMITSIEAKVVICVGDDNQFAGLEKELGFVGEKSQRIKLQSKDLPESGELLYHLY